VSDLARRLCTGGQQSSPAKFRQNIGVRDIRDNLPTVEGPVDHEAGRKREFDRRLSRPLKPPAPLRADEAVAIVEDRFPRVRETGGGATQALEQLLSFRDGVLEITRL
jgi:hypothetical protein